MSSNIGRLKFKRLKEYDTIWHEDSKLVFKSATEKLVVGRYVDGKMIKLDEEALEICKEWKFKYDETLLKNEEEEEEEEEEEGEEEGEEGEGEEEGEEEGGEEGEEVVSEEAVSEEAVSEEAVSEEAVSEEAVSDEAVSEEKSKNEVVIAKKEPNIVVSNKEDFSVKFVFLNKCLNELSSSVDSHKKNSENEICTLKDNISKRNKEYDILKNNYDNLEDQYLKLKAKFDGIKNFFS